MTEKLTIDLSPLEEFRYNQISNHKFEFMLVNFDMKVVHSPFECKDYLQDIFWCETRKRTSSVYGLSWKPGMFDISTPHFYLALSGGSETLDSRIEPLVKFINAFEEKLEIEPTVGYETENSKKLIVLKFSRDWTINGPMLSAYTTLIRAGGAYEDGDVLQYLIDLYQNKLKHPDYVSVERKRLSRNLPKLAALLQGKRPEHKWEDTDTIGMAHDTGITEFDDFPTAEVPGISIEDDEYDDE